MPESPAKSSSPPFPKLSDANSLSNASNASKEKSHYICIECTYPVNSLYTPYSNADDRSQGRGVRLTQCPRCKRFADKYVEHDFVVLFIDLVLIKPQVYRHLLFNRLGRSNDSFDPSILRLGILLLLFDVYLTWARIEKEIPPGTFHNNPSSPSPSSGRTSLSLASPTLPFHPLPISLSLHQQPLIFQYLFFLILCLTESLLFHLTIRLLSTYVLKYPRPNAVSTALLVSSCTKLFPILMVIWEYDVPAAAKSVGWAVVVNNVEALRILLDVDYVRAGLLAGAGAVVRAAGTAWILEWSGIGGDKNALLFGWFWEEGGWGRWAWEALRGWAGG